MHADPCQSRLHPSSGVWPDALRSSISRDFAESRLSPVRAESLQVFALGDDGEALVAHRQAASEVGLAVPADVEVGGDFHILVENGAADAGVAADLDAIEED